MVWNLEDGKVTNLGKAVVVKRNPYTDPCVALSSGCH